MWVRWDLDKVVRDADALSYQVGHATASKVLIAWRLRPAPSTHPHPLLASSRRDTTPNHHPALFSGWFLAALLVLNFESDIFVWVSAIILSFWFPMPLRPCSSRSR